VRPALCGTPDYVERRRNDLAAAVRGVSLST
jgi:hypothetical protein